MVNNCMDKCMSVMVVFPSLKAVIELEVHFMSWNRREGIEYFSGEERWHPSVKGKSS